MDNKLSELKEQLAAALATWQQTNGGKLTVGWLHAANPEVIATLLAELEEVTRQRDNAQSSRDLHAKVNTGLNERLIAVEQRLATPVRLPVPSSALDINEFAAEWRDCGIAESATALREQGFTVGDE
ncbi:Uncharacterised protein [Serratia proteamaculans]|uniref:hypothetical protein n=1 Tax=Serratia proteamaculans TaxID=28151 RepID=UPI00217CB677|nr:hypothetical protein [Serratia proteamaculans]CAI1579512.1 Uncharacterised protein [Serratia proteamaculans]